MSKENPNAVEISIYLRQQRNDLRRESVPKLEAINELTEAIENIEGGDDFKALICCRMFYKENVAVGVYQGIMFEIGKEVDKVVKSCSSSGDFESHYAI